MKMPFGKYKDQELEQLPNSFLNWVLREIRAEAPLTVRPENREQYVKTRRLLLHEAGRILKERAANRVVVPDRNKVTSARYGRRSQRFN